MPSTPTSMRLSADTIARLDAWAEHLTRLHGGRWGRAEVIDRLLDRAGTPILRDEAGAHDPACRCSICRAR